MSTSRVQSAAMASPFTPIADYGFLSDCHTGALVSTDGGVDWLCVPRFDAPSIFGSLLDREAGTFRFGPFGINVPTQRIYEAGTNVLVTTWKTPSGWVVVRDALVMGPTRGPDAVTPHSRPPADDDAEHLLVRTAECIDGQVELELVCEPVFDYGELPATWTLVDGTGHSADAAGGGVTIRVHTDMAMGVEGGRIRARRTLRVGDRVFCSLSWAEGLAGPDDVDDADASDRHHGGVLARLAGQGADPRPPVASPDPTLGAGHQGAHVHANGGDRRRADHVIAGDPRRERNWDYRYSWLRDSTFTLRALHWLNLDWEADEFMQFIAELEVNEDGGLQIMYGIDGRRDLSESTLKHMSGYAGAPPVRVGNGAFDQRQNDVFGAALDSILLHTRRSKRLPRGLWPLVQAQAECASTVWQEPDQGIWEARGAPKHYVSSKLMCWVALDRAAELAALRGAGDLEEKWRAIADEIHADIETHGFTEGGVLRQHYETDALDASTLLAPIFGFLPGGDKRARSSVLAIADELTENGYVLRYRTDETDDGLSGKEGTFLICSFWLVSALAIVGEQARARDLMERLLRISSPLGLYAEEFDVDTGYHLGNFPQAFSHLALIEAAARIIAAELREEFT